MTREPAVKPEGFQGLAATFVSLPATIIGQPLLSFGKMRRCKLAELPDELLIDIFTKVCMSEILDDFHRSLSHPDSALLYLSRRFLSPALVALYTEPVVRGEEGLAVFARTLWRHLDRAGFVTRLSIMCSSSFNRISCIPQPMHPFCRYIESVLQRASNLQQLVLKDVTITYHVIHGFRCLPPLRLLVIAGMSEFARANLPALCQSLLQCLAGLSLERFFWLSHGDEKGVSI